MGPLIGPKSDQNRTFQNQTTMAVEARYRLNSKKVTFFFLSPSTLKRDLRRVQKHSNHCGSTLAHNRKKNALQLNPIWGCSDNTNVMVFFFSCNKSRRKKRWFYDYIPTTLKSTSKNVLRFSEPWITTLVWICKEKIGTRTNADSFCSLAVFGENMLKKLATVLIESPKTTTFGSTKTS
jgi:hypothetical protein